MKGKGHPRQEEQIGAEATAAHWPEQRLAVGEGRMGGRAGQEGPDGEGQAEEFGLYREGQGAPLEDFNREKEETI